jgi:hypothetical protein
MTINSTVRAKMTMTSDYLYLAILHVRNARLYLNDRGDASRNGELDELIQRLVKLASDEDGREHQDLEAADELYRARMDMREGMA